MNRSPVPTTSNKFNVVVSGLYKVSDRELATENPLVYRVTLRVTHWTIKHTQGPIKTSGGLTNTYSVSRKGAFLHLSELCLKHICTLALLILSDYSFLPFIESYLVKLFMHHLFRQPSQT